MFSSQGQPTRSGWFSDPAASQNSTGYLNNSLASSSGGIGAGGVGSHVVGGLDDQLDDVEFKGERSTSHLPGFLGRTGVSGRPVPAESHSTHDGQTSGWNAGSSFGRANSGLPSPPSRSFGSGGLFDHSPTSPFASPRNLNASTAGAGPSGLPLEDAPPTASLAEMEYSVSPNNLAVPMQQYPSDLSMSMSPPKVSSSVQGMSLSPTASSTVIVFGPPMTFAQNLVDWIGQCGEVVSFTVDEGGGNWVNVAFKTEWEAARALRKNGEVLGSWMIGVKPLEGNLFSTPSRSATSTPILGIQSTSSASTQPASSSRPAVGRPLRVVPSTSAFKRVSPTTPVKKDGKPNWIEEDASKTQQGGSGVMSKLGEIVFGF